MSELETVIIMGVVIISFIINIIQHIYMNRLYKTTMMWKDQSKYLLGVTCSKLRMANITHI